ncbi:MAG: PTS sugar transporter subunit IIB [Anaerorhabdus sp.]
MINLVRCDDRLIHGQCMTKIVQHFFIKEIIVIDDFTANNAVLKLVFEKAVPPSMKAAVYRIDNCEEAIRSSITNDIGTLILFRSPLIAEKLYDLIDELPKTFMIGPVAKKAGGKEANFGTYLSKEEIESLARMVDKNIEPYFQILPEQKRFNWDDVKGKLI